MSVIAGILYHAAGASSASLCYTPQKGVKSWSWQTYWLAQSLFCWLLLPVVVAWLTIPHLGQVLREAPVSAMLNSFLLGAAYGVGGTAFGMAIRYVGFSLTYAIAVGISCVLGTLLPPVLDGKWRELLHQSGSAFIIAGITLGVLGIGLCGAAGRNKELDIEKSGQSATTGFSLSKGLPLCLLAGVLSAFYGLALNAGGPIAETAARYDAGNFKTNVIYIFSNSGAFVTTLLYCLYLHFKNHTWGEYRPAAINSNNPLLRNWLFSLLTGLLWYGQFFFYGLGHVRMGKFEYTSWAIHMIMLVLFSAVAGLILKEWIVVRSKTRGLLAAALAVLIAAVLILTYGNQLGVAQ